MMRQGMGLFLIVMGLLLVVASLLQNPAQGGSGYGGVVLIGPIPIVFGSSPEMALASMILAAVLMVFAIILFRGR